MNDLLRMSSTIIITVTGWLVIGQCLKIVSLPGCLGGSRLQRAGLAGRDSIKPHCNPARGERENAKTDIVLPEARIEHFLVLTWNSLQAAPPSSH